MHDVLISGGQVYDGTGAPAQRADIAIRGGRIVAVAEPGTITERAATRIDAEGLAVAPGFIDIHTHHDAQVFWDPACTPSPLHGVTTSVGGNCGFTIAPLDNGAGDYLMHMLSRVEGMPLSALQQGVPWNWVSTADYLARVAEQRPVMNMGFMVGHSALRRAVMGADAVGGTASPSQIEAMRALLARGLAAGGMGFTSSWSTTHCDDDGNPVPSRASDCGELVALSEVVAGYPAPQLEFSPTNLGFDEIHVDTMIQMARAARRPINWSIFQPAAEQRDLTLAKLAAADRAAEHGVRLLALMYPGVLRVRASFLGSAFDSLPGWAKFLAMPDAGKLAVLRDPAQRAQLDAMATSPRDDGTVHDSARWSEMVISETFHPANATYDGHRLGDLATKSGRDPFELLCEIVVRDELRTGVVPHATGADEATWQLREDAWRDPRVVLGGSDAGAHLDLITTFDWATAFLSLNRERGVLPWERAIARITGELASLYRLRDRGVLRAGAHADVVVFDPETIGSTPGKWRTDLPGGAGRLYADATGIAHVFVNGVEVVHGQALTGAQPGGVLRAGIDTVAP